jgi:CMP-N-acetylneuraminic acid synthetase
MFLWNLEKALRTFDEVYVSSDSEEILAMAQIEGAIPIKRGPELCGDVPNIPVYQHALSYMNGVSGVVAIQACSPTLNQNLLLITKRLLEIGVREVMTCKPIERTKDYHDQSSKIYGSVWGFSRHRLEFYADPIKPSPDVWLIDDSIDIHTQEDLEIAELQWQSTRPSSSQTLTINLISEEL